MFAYGSLKQSQNLTHKPWKCPQLPGTEIVRLWECKNTEFLWELKHGFLKAAISRTVHLRECLFPRYFYYSSELMCPGPLSLCNSLVSFHPSPCVFCFCYSFCLCFYLCVCLSHCSLALSCSHYLSFNSLYLKLPAFSSKPLQISCPLFALLTWLCCFH